MNYLGSLVSRLALCGLVLAVSSFAFSAQAEQKNGQAKVIGLKGSAYYGQEGGTWIPIKVNDVLPSASGVKTDPGSYVDLTLGPNGKLVRVMENTMVGLRLLYEDTGVETVTDTELNLHSGRLIGTVRKLTGASKYVVKVPTGTVSIRGSAYDISFPGCVHMYEGTAIVTYITPKGKKFEKIVNAGETCCPPADPESEPGVAPTPPDYQWPLLPEMHWPFGESREALYPWNLFGPEPTINNPAQTPEGPPVSPFGPQTSGSNSGVTTQPGHDPGRENGGTGGGEN